MLFGQSRLELAHALEINVVLKGKCQRSKKSVKRTLSSKDMQFILMLRDQFLVTKQRIYEVICFTSSCSE